MNGKTGGGSLFKIALQSGPQHCKSAVLSTGGHFRIGIIPSFSFSSFNYCSSKNIPTEKGGNRILISHFRLIKISEIN